MKQNLKKAIVITLLVSTIACVLQLSSSASGVTHDMLHNMTTSKSNTSGDAFNSICDTISSISEYSSTHTDNESSFKRRVCVNGSYTGQTEIWYDTGTITVTGTGYCSTDFFLWNPTNGITYSFVTTHSVYSLTTINGEYDKWYARDWFHITDCGSYNTFAETNFG